MNDLIKQHYTTNYALLVKRSTWRVPNKSRALAEECVQEAYTRALRYINAFNREDDFNNWFNRILRNTISDCRKAETDKGTTREIEEEIEELGATKEEKLYALATLSKYPKGIKKEVLTLFFFYGYRVRDISEYTGMSQTAIKQLVYRFKNKIRET